MSNIASSEISSESETEPSSSPFAFFGKSRGFAFLPSFGRGTLRYVEVSGKNPRNVFQNILAQEAITSLGKN